MKSRGTFKGMFRGMYGVRDKAVSAAGYTDYTADSDMVSYWLMEQSTAANATDGSASANTLSYNSEGTGPTQSSDHMEGSYSSVMAPSVSEFFYRTDANLSSGFPGKSSGGWTGSITVGAWVKLDATGENFVLFKWLNEGNFSFILKTNSSTQARFCISTNGTNDIAVNGGTTLSGNGSTWYHLVGVFDDTNNLIYVYVNGASDATAVSITGSMYAGTDALRVGKIIGHIDEAFVMKRALSAEEVQEIYDHGLAGDR